MSEKARIDISSVPRGLRCSLHGKTSHSPKPGAFPIVLRVIRIPRFVTVAVLVVAIPCVIFAQAAATATKESMWTGLFNEATSAFQAGCYAGAAAKFESVIAGNDANVVNEGGKPPAVQLQTTSIAVSPAFDYEPRQTPLP